MASSLIHVPPPPHLYRRLQNPAHKQNYVYFTTGRNSNPSIKASSKSSPDKEELTWLREEQRWLREEQRWIREESRWNSERDSLLREMTELKQQVQVLESGVSISDATVNLYTLSHSLKEADSKENTVNQITESDSSNLPRLLKDSKARETILEEDEISEKIVEGRRKDKNKSKASLRIGSEGDDVRVMQEALLKMGFYSGEEDMEYSSFSSDTERAVKTWQETIQVPEDGVMTEDLLDRLFKELQMMETSLRVSSNPSGNSTVEKKGIANGYVGSSLTTITEIEKTVIQKNAAELKVSEQRVFLLGENRWEDPSRLATKEIQIIDRTSLKCLACRGEGHILCTECDGTGEPNIESQFLGWVEDAKCPYCEGQGYKVCDLCEG